MKIFSACLAAETNTFSPIPTGLDDFNQVRAADIANGTWRIEQVPPLDVWQAKALARGDKYETGLLAWAQPAGPATRSTYEALRDEILSDLCAAGPVDMVLLFLHGAMMAQGYEDCEGDILARVREIVGPEVTVAVELDLHCHVTKKMISNATIINTYKEYPHTDVNARAAELFELAVDAQVGKTKPTMALFDCRMMGMYPTTSPQMRGFVNAMKDIEKKPDVLAVSFAHSFPFGDMPDGGGKMLVVTDNNPELAASLTEELGMQLFSMRHQIDFPSLPLDEALSKAVSLSQQNNKPVVVADQSDNAGGGAPSDSTFALGWLLKHEVQNAAVAIMYDPEVVKLAKAAGIGAEFDVRLGGKIATVSGDPLDIRIKVLNYAANYIHKFPQDEGEPSLWPIGDVAALQCQGIDILVSSIRGQCLSPCIFDDLGIDPKGKSLMVIKSTQHFYGPFAPIASEVIYMAGPGAVPLVMQQIRYTRMRTDDKYPWVDDPFVSKQESETSTSLACIENQEGNRGQMKVS